ncbi:MAG: MBL fold metallo-hydrolase, partial [bacterium]
AYFPKAEHLVSRREYENDTGAMGLLRGFLPHRWPRWFRPTLIDMQPEPIGSFPSSYRVTQAGDVRFVPTPGHTVGHLSVVVTTPEVSYLLAGDASYTQELMLQEQTDGVGSDRQTTRRTLERIHSYCRSAATVYLPAHDPDTPDRLANRQLAVAPATPNNYLIAAKLTGPAVSAQRLEELDRDIVGSF